MSNILYAVRQYRPNYCEGFINGIAHNMKYDEITSAPWFDNFKYEGFVEFIVERYTDDELIISALYKDGKRWVAGFACKENNKLAKDWRYLTCRTE